MTWVSTAWRRCWPCWGGAVPPPFAPHLTHLLDEAPVPLVVMAVEEAAERAHVPLGRVWRNVAKLAGELAIHRKALWV